MLDDVVEAECGFIPDDAFETEGAFTCGKRDDIVEGVDEGSEERAQLNAGGN